MKRSYLVEFIDKYTDLAVGIRDAALTHAAAHLDTLDEWSGAFNLVGEMPDEERAGLLYLDSMIVASRLAGIVPQPADVHDVGSGAGFPGLFLPAFFGPRSRFFLHESRRRRANFLKTAARAMGIANVVVSNRRVEPGAFSGDLVLSRATFPPEDWLTLSATLLRPGGRAVLLKSGHGAPVGLPPPGALDLDRVLDYVLPVSGRERAIVIYVGKFP